MNREKLYLSTIDPKAGSLARAYGLGIEIADFCTAWNMDDCLPQTDQQVRQTLNGTTQCLLHAPFNELFPCAIDPKARALARQRFCQAIDLAHTYGAKKVIIHGGYQPYQYYRQWYTEQSAIFWKEFLQQDPGVEIVLENVLEPEPELLLAVVQEVADPCLRLCLDIGHVNAYSRVPVFDWIEKWSPFLSHLHIHNNDGTWDTHSPLQQGTLSIREICAAAEAVCPDATYTLELPDGESSVHWLLEDTYGI